MSTTTTSDWNDAVAKVMAESGASKEAAEEALHESGGNVDGAHCTLMRVCHFSFYRCVVSLQQ
jgi:NACalpha-BTF3-like transcription factor